MADLFEQYALENDKQEKYAEEREEVIESLRGGKQLNTKQLRVAYILSQYPETRNSDITLMLQYWRIYQPHLYSGGDVPRDALYALERHASIARHRAHIQNDLKLFVATRDEVRKKRNQLGEEFRTVYTPTDITVPGLWVFADESGKDGNSEYLIVGSLWMLSVGEYRRVIEEIRSWRKAKGVKHEFHASALGNNRLLTFKEYIQRFILNEGLFGFKALALHSAGISDRPTALSELFHLSLRIGLEHEVETGRVVLPRRLDLTKDQDEPGYDQRTLAYVRKEMTRDAETIFRSKLTYGRDYAADSKGEPLLQSADFYTWCVNRKLNVMPHAQERTAKDDLVDWFLSEVGFELRPESVGDRAVLLSLNSPNIERVAVDPIIPPEPEADKFTQSESRTVEADELDV